MADFRKVLYERYVSAFKTENLQDEKEVKERFWPFYRQAYLPLLNDLDRDVNILEIGCGPGQFLLFLREHGFTNASGIDLSEEQIAIAKTRKLEVAVADAISYLDPHSGEFDLIIAIDLLEHFAKDELLEMVGMICRALKPGGLLIAQTPNGQGLFSGQIAYGDLTHMTILNPNSLEQLARICGFEQVIFFETARVDAGLKGVARKLLWSLVKAGANLIRRIETGKTQKIWSENMICICRKPEEK